MNSKDDLLTNLGRRVRELRLQQAYSQDKLAERCGFDRTYISMVERGKRNPSFSNLVKLADGLGVSLLELTAGLWPGLSNE